MPLITEQQLTQLVKSVWRATRDEFLGLSSEPCNNGTFALMCDYCLGSATLGAVLRKSARNDTDHLLQEFLVLMWERLSCWLVDQQIPFARTQFSYPAPAHEAEYRAMYPGELKFEQPVCGFLFHEKYLQLPIVRSEEELRQFLQAAPAYILHRPSQDESLRARIHALLARYNYPDMPGLDALGRELHMTPRNIGRKLQDERREHATRLMTSESLSISEIAELVGFSETAAFSRAFKRWTGLSPARWRGSQVNG